MTAILPDRTLAAAGAILIYAAIIGFIDNYVRVVAAEGGLWQFHAIRAVIVFAMIAVVMRPLRLNLRMRNPRAVAARCGLHAAAMLIYFGCLAFLPVAQVAAGLFTAPIFVLLISRFGYGHPIGPVRIGAVAVGFVGVMLVLAPDGNVNLSPAALLPVAAGAIYAMGSIATREWCPGETAEAITLGFFAALGLAGTLGVLLLAFFPQPVPEGAAGFILRGWVWPSGTFLFWTFVQALGSLIAVGLMVRAYQLAEASRVAVFEYAILPFAALFGFLIWDERVALVSGIGMGLIALAGALIALRAR